MDVDTLSGPNKSMWNNADQMAHEQREADKGAFFQSLLAASDPIAMICQAFGNTLMEDPAATIGTLRSRITAAEFKESPARYMVH